MGVWGTGLYGGDFAKDLGAVVRAVSRLPHGGDKLLEILIGVEPGAANNPSDADHTTFWLVVADQFAKRGIVCEAAQSKAIHIIDGGSDIAMLSQLGMERSSLTKRKKMLVELRTRLMNRPKPAGRGPILKKPQPFLMNIGDVFAYPMSKGRCINSYASSKERIPGGWKQDSWTAMIVVDRGRAFDFLTWYRPLTLSTAVAERPEADFPEMSHVWLLRNPGTCSALHFRRLELEKIGSLRIDSGKLARAFPKMSPGTSQAISDISIVNQLSAVPERNFLIGRDPYPKISGLEEILS